MKRHVTLAQADSPFRELGSASGTLPPDLLKQVRARVRVLTLLLLVAFAFDPVIFFGAWAISVILHLDLASGFLTSMPFQWVNVGAVVASAGFWWTARRESVSPSRLHTLGLCYEVVVCFVVALITSWRYYNETGMIPNLTWVPVLVVLFPLILPGPPRRMLLAAIAAAAMPVLALTILVSLGKVTTDPEAYPRAIISGAFAVIFAYMGARVVYGLGRQVAEARELGSYQRVERIGQGGMGEVWRARHRFLARPAAIKLIRGGCDTPDGASAEAVQRFEREAQAIASLRCPHTVGLFDFGVADDGAFYYVMELLDGLDVDALVRRYGPVSPSRATHLVRQMCQSLSEAHRRGLVHRDIKPANIFLGRYGEEHDFVKVLDFGLVKALDSRRDEDAGLTADNAVRGTPAFIAPEQALGESDIDGRADIYATGCVLYWLLTGRPVFTADTPMGLVMQHARSIPEPPSARTDQPIPPAMDRLVLSCLAKDRGDRPQSARNVAVELAEIPDDDPWTEERAQAWWASIT